MLFSRMYFLSYGKKSHSALFRADLKFLTEMEGKGARLRDIENYHEPRFLLLLNFEFTPETGVLWL